MPFTIQKNKKGQHCVFKKNEQDEVVGESLGCHPSKKEAIAQIGAIESKEKRKEEGKSVNYISVDDNGTFSPFSITTTDSITTTNADYIISPVRKTEGTND
jgi:hypothetical protein